MYKINDSIIAGIENERSYQINELGYTSAIDDGWSFNDWSSFVTSFLGRAFFKPEGMRHTFIIVAALAIAAIEAIDRKAANAQAA